MDKLAAEGKSEIDGRDIFKLYDTYGFQVELTEELAEHRGMTLDIAGFEAAMKEQQDRARASVVKGGSMGMQMKPWLLSQKSRSLFTAKQLLKQAYLSLWLIMRVQKQSQKVKPSLSLTKHHSMQKWVVRLQTMVL